MGNHHYPRVKDVGRLGFFRTTTRVMDFLYADIIG